MSVKYEKFLTEVTPYVHDCPEFVAIHAIRNAVIEFCTETKIIQEQLDPITLIPNVKSYDLDVDDGYMPAGVMAAWCNNLPMDPKSEDDLRRIYPQDWRSMTGRPAYWTQQNYDELIVVPYPTERSQNALKVITALTPSRDSTEVDDRIWNRYAETIGFGARARLYETTNQPYYDPQSAVLYRNKFLYGIGKAKIDATRGLSRTTVRVRPQRLV